MKTKIPALALAAALGCGAALAQHAGHGAQSPYAGLQSRDIKALSAEEQRALLEGQGMRLALAAELNGYPGPLHVLEHAEALRLSPAQRQSTQALMDTHKDEARALGAQLLEAERALDRAFAARSATPEAVADLTQRIGTLQARLRSAHLQTHVRQSALLTPEQVAQYQQLRGYASAHPHGGKH